MDWNTVKTEELVAALLAERDWTHPRPLPEMLGRLNIPKRRNLDSRLKANLYYYRSNYAVMLALVLVLALIRQPFGLLCLGVLALGGLCTQDAFAAGLNERALRVLRRLSPALALKVRAAAGPASAPAPGAPPKRDLKILAVPRAAVVIGLEAAGAVALLLRPWLLLRLVLAAAAGAALIAAHAAARSPNLKARLSSAREEFQATWRGNQAEAEAGARGRDYAL